MKWSFRIARVFGIDVKIHITFSLILILGAMQWSRFGGRGMLFGVLLMLLLFLCVTLHELGHSVVAQRFGIRVREIVLLPIGGVAMLARNPSTPLQELLIAIAGPAVNVVIAVILGSYVAAQSYASGIAPQSPMEAAVSGPSSATMLIWLLNANVILVLFNMIPAFPLDGGRVLRALLGMVMEPTRATTISAGVGQIMALALGALAIFAGQIVLAFIAAFIFLMAGATRQDEQAKSVLSSRKVGDVYKKYALVLDETDRVSRVVDYLLSSYQDHFAVVRSGELLGVVSREEVVESVAMTLADEPVTSIMLRDIPGVDASTKLDEVRQVMDEQTSRVVAVYDCGVFLGLTSAQDLADALAIIAYQQRRQRRCEREHATVNSTAVARPA